MTEDAKTDLLSVLASVNDRLKAVEADNAALRLEMQAAREQSGIALDNAHVNHFADKWFHHDRPDSIPAPAEKPKYDPMTGERLISPDHAAARAQFGFN